MAASKGGGRGVGSYVPTRPNKPAVIPGASYVPTQPKPGSGGGGGGGGGGKGGGGSSGSKGSGGSSTGRKR